MQIESPELSESDKYETRKNEKLSAYTMEFALNGVDPHALNFAIAGST